jgi:hypothetical protein
MLILDKWKLKDTLTLLSHPERARTAAITTEHQLREAAAHRVRIAKEERRAAYESAYRELMEEIAEEFRLNDDHHHDGDSEIVWKRN